MWSSAPNTWWLSHEPQLYFVLAYSTMLTCWNQMVNVVHNHYKWTSSCQTSQWLVSPQQVKLCDSVQSHKRNQSLLFDSRPSGTFDSVTVELSSELPAWRQTGLQLCVWVDELQCSSLCRCDAFSLPCVQTASLLWWVKVSICSVSSLKSFL